ncbi:MAG TPA: DUF998 domain-containing protein [Pseudonocardia sp.]|jgi:hypothetical protein|nr:DUF998 domain-containing protein [Pseudonocardia sp.]
MIDPRFPALGVLGFWVGTLAAAALAPGYSLRADYVSSLAGRGSEVAVLGIAALVALALAHLAAAARVAAVVRDRGAGAVGGGGTARRPGSRAAAALAGALALAGLAGLVVAAFRTACPLGAAGCGTPPNDVPPDLADRLHVLGVVGYEVALVAAMALVAAGAAGRSRAFRALSASAAVASVVLLLQVGGPDTGAWQRAWLVVNTGWLALSARSR